MGRSFRHRSSSGGSYTEMKPSQVSMDDAAAQELIKILLNLKDASSGKSFLHSLSDSSQVSMAHALFQRASILQDTFIQQQLLQQPDEESGYTPLHWALCNGNLSAILLLLRQTSMRLTRRPMELLSEVEVKDKEGMTPLQLLGMLQRNSLKQCRKDMEQQLVAESPVVFSNNRNVVDDEQEELALLRENMHLLQLDEEEIATSTNTSTACEVVTFGRSHHVALGVPCSDATHPQRVAEFGLDMRHINGSAILVAAATHHTLVVTSTGSLYACGLGKGGRLGTGDERQRPVFSLVGISQRRKVVHAAAAENHSLCVTSDGRVFAFGSNRFGQLGLTGEDRCFLPRKVDDLRNVHVLKVAAGDKHSMALTGDGQVYTWGDNQAGQLGARRTASTGKVQLVESLWNAKPRKVAICIAASEHSSLILTKPCTMGLPVNAVYQWGHGNHVPIKVNFTSRHASWNVNPVDIACAKYHNAAVTQDGHVYTWGLHAEPLGNTLQQSSMVIASPQLVEGMLRENGGGFAVAVSAAEHHTAVVTDCGHLYTWGATFGKNVLGHEGVRWQPSPKKVVGIHRAVAVAAGKEHNVVLMGTNFPCISPTVSSLETLAAQQVAKHVDLFNVLPILITAERVECSFLKEYCNEFIRLNLDGVLSLGRKSEMDCYLNEQLAAGFDEMDHDSECHPLVYDVIMAGTMSSVKEFDSVAWTDACKTLLERLPVSTLVKYRKSVSRGSGSVGTRRMLRRSRTLSIHDDEDGEQAPGECSERCLLLTANLAVKTCDAAQSKVDSLSKEVRSVRKLLNQIARLELAESLTPDQKQKVKRKLLLETDLALLEPALENAELRLRELRQEEDVFDISSPIMEVKEYVAPESTLATDDQEGRKEFVTPENGTAKTDVQVYRCDLCSISCSDANSLALHKNGRKHRNRLQQVEEDDQRKVAASILEDKRRQMLLSDNDTREAPSTSTKKKSVWNTSSQSIQPRYRLPPPPHFPTLEEAAANSPPTKSQKISWSKSSAPVLSKATSESTRPPNAMTVQGKYSLKSPVPSPSTKLLSPGPIPDLVSPPWASSSSRIPVSSVLTAAPKERESKTYSLGDFMYSPSPPVEKPTSTSAPWSKVTPKTSIASLRLLDIQQEEQAIRDKEHTRLEGKWYINQRVQASSISAIQEAEERNREHVAFVEEQRRIEEQIQQERRQQESKAKARNRKSKRPKKKRETSSIVGCNDQKPGKSGNDDNTKRRPSNRKKSNAGGDASSSTVY